MALSDRKTRQSAEFRYSAECRSVLSAKSTGTGNGNNILACVERRWPWRPPHHDDVPPAQNHGQGCHYWWYSIVPPTRIALLGPCRGRFGGVLLETNFKLSYNTIYYTYYALTISNYVADVGNWHVDLMSHFTTCLDMSRHVVDMSIGVSRHCSMCHSQFADIFRVGRHVGDTFFN